MTLIAAIDTETTGLDPKTDRVIEIGAVLWEVETKRPMQILSELVKTNTSIDPEAAKVNGLSHKDLHNYGTTGEVAFNKLKVMILMSDYIMGHNINRFDKPFIENEFKRNGIEWVNRPIIDTYTDVKYKHGDLSRRLVHISASHGIINPFPHRAVFDVLTMLQVASLYPFEDIIRRVNSPTKTLKAVISYDGRQKAKDAGFRWDGSQWIKDIKDCDEETYLLPTVVL